MPTSAEVLAEAQRPLVPVAILSAPVESASEGEPLVETGEVQATTAQEGEGEDEEPEEDEDEVIIPVDPGDETPEDPVEPPTDGEAPTTVEPGDAAPRTIARGDGLALTGLAVEGPFGVGLALLLLGGLMRITARPTSSPARA